VRDNEGPLAEPQTWIRDDWWLPQCSIPDTDNDEVKGSSGARDSPNKNPSNGLRRDMLKISNGLYLIDITGIIYYLFFS